MAASVLEVLITGDATSLTKALDQATSSAKKMETNTGSAAANVGTALKAVAPAFLAVGAAAVAGVTKGIVATQQWASDTRTLQRITGESAESASSLLTASNLLGISTSSLSTAFGALSKNIVNGSANMAKYGIATQDAHGATLPFDDVLGNVIDKFQTLEPGAEQTAFAMNVFGRSGKDLIPILAKGRQGMAELEAKAADLGLVMSQDDVDASKALSAAQRELGLALKGAFVSISQLFIPALTKLVGGVTRAVEWITKLPAPVKEIGVGAALAAGAVGGLTLAFSALQKTFSPVISGIESIGKALVESGLFQNAATALSTTATGIQAVGEAAQKGGDQLSLFGDSGNAALQDVSTAANVAAVGLAKTGKDVTFFEAAGQKVAAVLGSVGEGLAGIGSGIVAALTSPAAIIAGIIAAVAILAVVVVKNWNTIKTALGPVGDFLANLGSDLKDAFLALGPPLAELGKSLGDLGSALATAFGPLLPILAPIAKVLAVIGGAIVFGPLLLAVKGLTVGFQALAVVIKAVATAVEATANFIIRAVNAVIGQINNVIGASNKWLHTNFDTIPTVKELGDATADTASATGDLTDATNAAADAQGKLGRTAGPTTALLQRAAPLLRAMGTSFGDLSAAAQAAFEQAQSSGADMTAAFETFRDQQIQAAQQARDAFKTQAQAAISFASSMLSTLEQTAEQAQQTLAGDTSDLSSSQLTALRDQANLTARDILHTFDAAASQTKSFGRDLLELAHTGGKAGRNLANSLLQSGDVLAAQVIADSPDKLRDQIVHAFGKSETAADSLSTKLTNAIVGPLKGIQHILRVLAEQVFHVDLSYNDHGASGKLATFDTNLDRLTSKTHYINVITHIEAGSPWPDEALKQHLFDPLAKAGAKRINGRLTLPLDVTVHTDIGGTLEALHPHPDMTMGFRDEGFMDRLLKNAPRLPQGHTHIDNSLPTEPRLRQSMVVNLDRKRFVDATTQEVSYGRGY